MDFVDLCSCAKLCLFLFPYFQESDFGAVEKAYWDVRGPDPTVHIHLCRARIEEPAHER